MKSKKNGYSALLFCFFLVVAGITLLPLALLAVASFRPGTELMRTGLNFNIDFATVSLNNYVQLFNGSNPYFYWYKNSLVITIVQVSLTLFLSACVGYGFAMYDFKGKNLLFICVLVVMMIPTEILLLPLYRMTIAMNTIDTMWGIILPYIVAPMLVFFFRQYLSGIPRDFLDAARVDGCTEYGIFFRIMIPLMRPSFAAMGIYQGMQSWNSFLWPMIVMRTANKITLPVGLASLMTPYGNNYDILLAGSCFAIRSEEHTSELQSP